MSLISSEIVWQSNRGGGMTYVKAKYTFHDGLEIFIGPAEIPVADVSSWLAARASDAEVTAIDVADEAGLSGLESGEIADAMAYEPAHPSTDSVADRKKRFHRKLVRWAMLHEDLKVIRRVFYPIWYYLKFESGYTAQQIANYLDITVAKLSTVNNRFQNLHDHLALIDDDFVTKVE